MPISHAHRTRSNRNRFTLRSVPAGDVAVTLEDLADILAAVGHEITPAEADGAAGLVADLVPSWSPELCRRFVWEAAWDGVTS